MKWGFKMKEKIKNIIMLQGAVVIYTFSGIMAKNASASRGNAAEFMLFVGLEFAILAVYAILWQQLLKRFELSVAYANRSAALLWSMLWASLFFHEPISLKNIAGVLLVLLGTVVINADKGADIKAWEEMPDD